MRAYHIAVPLVLFLWQSAPVQFVPGRSGGVRLSIAGSAGSWEDYQKAQFDCNGNESEPEHSSVTGSSSLAARADLPFDQAGSHVTVVAGRVTTDSAFVPHGLFLGGLVVFEGPGAGFGIGVRHWGTRAELTYSPYPDLTGWPTSTESGVTELSALLRVGPLAGAHLRAEYHPIDETPALSGDVRAGLGIGQGPRRHAGGMLGIELGPKGQHSGGSGLAFFGELSLPLPAGVDLLFRGLLGPGHRSEHWGIGAGVRATLGPLQR